MCSPLPALGSFTQALLRKTEHLRHVVALPALWVGAKARVCKPQGWGPLAAAGRRQRFLAGSSPASPSWFPSGFESPDRRDLHALAHFCQQREQVLCLGTGKLQVAWQGVLLGVVEWSDLEQSWQDWGLRPASPVVSGALEPRRWGHEKRKRMAFPEPEISDLNPCLLGLQRKN